MPIWTPAFFCFMDWRRWCALIQQALARHRFAAEPVFFSAKEDTRAITFVDRVLQFNPDYVLWLLPTKSETNAMRGFADAGVPVLSVNWHRDDFPARVYPISRDQALQQGLKEWKQSGEVNEIIILLGEAGTAVSESMKFALKNCRLPHRVETFSGRRTDLPRYLARLISRPHKGIIFEDNMFYALACLWEPEAMLKLFRRHRVMAERQVLIPGCRTEGITTDVLSYSYERLARRIALDLSQAKGGIASRQPIFQAEWRPQTPLEEVSQYNIVE